MSVPAESDPWVPAEIGAYAGVPDTLGAGLPGKVGRLRLRFELRGGRSELVDHYQQPPLQIMRPLHVDPGLPDLPVVYLMSTGGGIVQADRLRIDIGCGAGASVLITTQAATKVHGMDTDYATQSVHLTAGPGGCLEYLPEPTILFARSRFHQRTVVTVDPAATAIVADTVVAGRLARGERHDYDAFTTDVELCDPAGRPFAVDRIRPARDINGPGVFGEATLLGTLYVVAPADAAAVAAAIDAALAGLPVRCGVSTLPGERGAWVRMLGTDPPAIQEAMWRAWDAARRATIGTPAPRLRGH